jgi:hypothetical protein
MTEGEYHHSPWRYWPTHWLDSPIDAFHTRAKSIKAPCHATLARSPYVRHTASHIRYSFLVLVLTYLGSFPKVRFLPCLRGRPGHLRMKVSNNLRPSMSSPTYYSALHPEAAPLLQDNTRNGGTNHPPTSSIINTLGSILQNPLTALNKILLILLLILLLLSSIFIGLFIGSQHKFRNEPGTPGDKNPPSTLTTTITTTAVTTVTGAPPPGPSTPPGEAGSYSFSYFPISIDNLVERMLYSGMRCALRSHPLFFRYHSGPL